ncbi:HNH endonuclease signature motif containing protein [Microbacterium sp. CIAB417]|uniref:HNH endonuclease signature motif containing protein n=1 Tax=Microbacterium sp. CIAB417 TaxID=2860287 RepID=UPI001FAB901C|nr:HNH endonuclease signature motif containing protein [Microbacterium sp. CIAB417]
MENSPADILDQVATGLRELLSGDALAGSSDAERAGVLAGLGLLSRLMDAAIIETVATADVDFGHRYGCRGMNEMLQRTLLADAPTASRLTRAAGLVQRDVNLLSGERLPARWAALREAMLDGAIGVTGLLGATAPFEQAGDRIALDERIWADAILAAMARGRRPDTVDADANSADLADADPSSADDEAGPPATAEDLRQFAQVLATVLDPDGAEPTDCQAQSRRFLRVGRLTRGTHPLHGNITPEMAAQLQLIFDAFDNPKVGGAPDPGVLFRPTGDEAGELSDEDPFNSDPRNVIDPRTRGQKRHDALAAALGVAARHEEMPSLGGAAPTLVVTVDAKDLASGTGWATMAGSEAPVPLHVAAHTACAGAIQRVLFDEGRIIGITVSDRVFTVHQRRAIVARDRECLIPGCHVPATWCEIHHVTEHARGGPTHTDNGVPLCWWHHRSLEHSGWEIRMNGGVPQIRGPEWWDRERKWRTPRLSVPTGPPRRRLLRT